METVDILLATYNGEAYLAQQIDSLLSQTYPHIRVIVRDDGSTDSTRDILSSYKDKIEVVFGDNVGVRQNFSLLMQLSNAPYAMFCDQDDVWHKEKVEKSVGAMRALEEEHGKETPFLVHTDLRVVDKDLRELSPSFWRYANLNPERAELNRIMVQNVVTGCTTLINRPLVKLASSVPTEAVMHDWWLALAASAFGKIGFIPDSTIAYRQHDKNQIGAIKYSLTTLIQKSFRKKALPHQNYLRNLFKKRTKNISLSVQYKQVEAFHHLFGEKLNRRQKKMIEAYLSLPFCSYLTSRLKMIRFGFFRSGFIRNIGVLLLTRQP